MTVLLTPSSPLQNRIASFFGILGLVGVITLDVISRLITSACIILGTLTDPDFANNARLAQPNGLLDSFSTLEQSELNELGSIFLTSLVTCFGIKNSRSFKDSMMTLINAGSKLKSLEYLVEICCKWIRKAICWVRGEQDPELIHIENLQKQSEEMKAWAEEVDLLTSMNNQDRIFSDPALRKRVAACKDTGTSFFTQIQTLPRGVTPAIVHFYKRIVELYDQVGMRLGGGETPQEAISIWIYGPPGCGKSHMMDPLAIEVMRAMKIVYNGNPIYNRDGNTFWNGLAGQPCVTWDDVGVNRSPEWMSQFVQEFFSVHTCAPYNPIQADLRDKNRILNAKLVMVGSNQTTFKANVVGEPTAFKRRRDFLICARINELWLNDVAPGALNCNDPRITAEDLKDFEHLEFRLQSPFDETDYSKDTTGPWLTYPKLVETLIPLVKNIDAKRKFAASTRHNLSDSLSVDYWASQADAPTLPRPVQTLAEDIAYLSARVAENSTQTANSVPSQPDNTAMPNILATTFESLFSFFSRSDENRYIEPELYSDFALAPGSREAIHDVQYGDDWESSLDFTRISCPHYDLNTTYAYTYETDTYNLRNAFGSIQNEECPNCSLTKSGRLILLNEILRQDNLQMGARMDTQATNAEIYSAFRLRRFNFHNIIDTLLDRLARFEFVGWLSRNAGLCLGAITTVAYCMHVYGMVKHEINTSKRLNIKYNRELNDDIREEYGELIAALAQQGISIDKETLQVIFEAEENLQASGDVRTHRPKAARRTVARRATPNANDFSNVLNKNLAFLSFRSHQTGKMMSIHVLMVEGKMGLVPQHFLHWLDSDQPSWTDIEITAEEYSKISQKKTSLFFSNTSADGPLRLTCKGKPPLYAGFSEQTRLTTNIRNTLASRSDLFNIYDFSSRLNDSLFAYEIFDLTTSETRLLTLKHRSATTTFYPEDIEVLDLDTTEELDLACVNFNVNSLPSFKSIRNHIASESDHNKLNLDECELYSADGTKVYGLPRVSPCERLFEYPSGQASTLVGFEYSNPQSYYPCTSILFDWKHSLIIGLHVCSKDRYGYAVGIAQEMLPATPGIPVVMPDVTPDPPKFDLAGEFISIGSIPNAVNQSPHSAIIPSLLHDSLPKHRYPARLRHSGDRFAGEQPLRIGCQKQTIPAPIHETAAERSEISDFLHNHIISLSTPTHAALPKRSISETISGIRGVPFIDPMDLSTSAGYPLCQTGKKSKSDYIKRDSSGNVTYIAAALADAYNKSHKTRLNRQRPPVVFMDFLKDERLKPGKDTRLINGSPLDYTLEVRRYFLDFLSAFQARRFNNFIAIGMNVHGPDTSQLVNTLLKKGDHFICGDYSAFGPTLDPGAVAEFASLTNSWYDQYVPENTDLDNAIRTGLILDGANAMHVAHDHVYQTLCGSPSGSPLTAPLNTYVNLRYMCRAWLHLTKPYHALNNLASFRDLVGIVAYGDDIIMSTSASVASFFNNETLSDYFSLLGITYTDATKTGTEKFCTLEKATFLKCNFLPHPTRKGQWLAALDWKCVEETPAWVRKSPDLTSATLQNCNAALLNAHGHGPLKYQDLLGKVQTSLKALNIPFSAQTWTSLDDNFFDTLTVGYTSVNATLTSILDAGEKCVVPSCVTNV